MVITPPEQTRINRTKASALWALLAVVSIAATMASSPRSAEPLPQVKAPQFLNNNEIALPEDYREWIFVSSGVGMSYGAEAREKSNNPPFNNVFVKPEAYRSFMRTGKWPNGTMFVMEMRRSKTNESINSSGSFQSDLLGVEAEVKDESRFPAKWGFYTFNNGAKAGKLATAATSDCQSCHSQHGAVDNTFVQFYPTLFEVAKKKGTVKDQY
jgi:hypothetical protein